MPRQKYSGKTIRIDGRSFANTDFENCTFVYSGMQGVSFKKCKFSEPHFVFDGPAANTMRFLHAMYHSGGAFMVERAFEEIRGNAPIKVIYN